MTNMELGCFLSAARNALRVAFECSDSIALKDQKQGNGVILANCKNASSGDVSPRPQLFHENGT